MHWYSRVITDNPPFSEFSGHNPFLYYKYTSKRKNIALHLAWLTYGAAKNLFKNDRIVKFTMLEVPNDINLLVVRKGSNQILIKEEGKNE